MARESDLFRAVKLCQRGGLTCVRLFHRLLGAENAVDAELVTGQLREAQDLLVLLENMELVRVAVEANGRTIVRVKRRGELVLFAADVERAGQLMAEVEQNEPPKDEARFVATFPETVEELDAGTARPSPTSFTALAKAARKRLAIVIPFLDERGLAVFRAMAAISARQRARLLVVTRTAADAKWPNGILGLARAAGAVEVEVLTPLALRPDGAVKDLVHAKVVLADEHTAYVGSANLTGGGMVDTIEAGVILHGPCVAPVVEFVDRLAEWARERGQGPSSSTV